MSKARVTSLEGFDPQKDPVVLSARPVRVSVGFFPKFRIGGTDFGPYKSQTEELPTFAAVSILSRGLGEVS